MDTIEVKMLGGFSLAYKNRSINDSDNRSKKTLSLLQYLIYNRGRGVPESEIIDSLWPQSDSDNPSNALKTLLFRVRSLLTSVGVPNTKDVITHRQYYFCWSGNAPVRVDIDEFQELCEAGERDESERLSCLLRALDLYRGDFLASSSSDFWVMPISSYYHNMYASAVRDAVNLLDKRGRYDDITSIMTKAVTIDPYCEDFYIYLIKALINSQSYATAKRQYENALDLFYTQFGISPSEEFLALYPLVVKSENEVVSDMLRVKEMLNDYTAVGARLCEFEFFKQYYGVMRAFSSRHGVCVHLSLITVSTPSGDTPPVKKLRIVMDRLSDCIRTSLRQSDVYTRFSVSQFLMMLPLANWENTVAATERVVRTFSKQNPKSGVLLNFTVQSIDVPDVEG